LTLYRDICKLICHQLWVSLGKTEAVLTCDLPSPLTFDI